MSLQRYVLCPYVEFSTILKKRTGLGENGTAGGAQIKQIKWEDVKRHEGLPHIHLVLDKINCQKKRITCRKNLRK